MNELDRLKLFKYMFNDMVIKEGSDIKRLALNKWVNRNVSAMDALLYGMECVINGLIEKENAKVLEKDADK